MSLIETAAQWALKHPGARVVFPDGLDVRSVCAAIQLQQKGYGQPILLANPFEMRDFCLREGLKLGGVSVIDPKQGQLLELFANEYISRKPEVKIDEAMRLIADPLWFGAMMLSKGEADYCIAGNVSSTASVLRAGLKVIGLAEGNKTVSSLFFMVSPDGQQTFGFADCAVVPEPNSTQLADIAIASALSYQNMTGNIPKVAMLSFSSKGSAKHPAAEAVKEACGMVRERAPELIVDGELQFDAAFVPKVAAQKVPDSPLSGNANVFVFPNLAAGNIGYKIAQRMGGYGAIGPLIQGLKYPMHDLSRGCSTEDMIDTALLAMKIAPLSRN